MSDLTFKKFVTYVDLKEEPTPEQLQEIFGMFFGKDEKKLKELKAKRDALLAAEKKKKREIAMQKDKIWANTKKNVENPFDKETGSATLRSKAAAGRSADREWLAQLTNEK